MDRDPDPLKPRHPPRLAETLIAVLSQRRVRDGLLGDLAEEFETRASESYRGAWIWYWGQALRSSGHLIFVRLSEHRLHNVFFGIGAILLGTIFMLAWDTLVSRNSARMIAAWETPPTLTLIRCVYFSVLGIGAAFCGILIARTMFSSQRTFWRNSTLYLAPIFLILASLALLTAIERGIMESSAYLLLRTGIISLTMLGASAIVYRGTREN